MPTVLIVPDYSDFNEIAAEDGREPARSGEAGGGSFLVRVCWDSAVNSCKGDIL